MASSLLRSALLWTIVAAAGAHAAPPADNSTHSDAHSLDEVTVTAQKFDRRTLENVIIPHFVQSHVSPNPIIKQMGRWQTEVCPNVTGLDPNYAELVAHRVAAVAKDVGAPAGIPGGKCGEVNVEIVFTPAPQELLTHIARTWPKLLGSARSSHDTRFDRAI